MYRQQRQPYPNYAWKMRRKSFSCKIAVNENVTVFFHACFESSMDRPNKSSA